MGQLECITICVKEVLKSVVLDSAKLYIYLLIIPFLVVNF
jgi:hypothetical protein